MDQLYIAVLAGGLSDEREVSLTSASLVANALSEKGHKVCLVDVCEDVNVSGLDRDSLFSADRRYSHSVGEAVPDKKSAEGRRLIGNGIAELCLMADVVYIGLHGGMGENGQLQAYLDALGVKYTGSGYLGSALAMDKDISKQLMRHSGVLTANWVSLDSSEIVSYTDSGTRARLDSVVEKVGLPCVVKPQSNGSSVGISIVENREELDAALAFAFLYEKKVLIERMIKGREFSIGILGGRVLPPVEIIPKSGFYDYKNKYQSDMTEEICPASLTECQNAALARAAEEVFRALRLDCYARMDFILDGQSGEFYCLEANTLPGMTPSSLLPLEAAAAGIDYGELCCRIIELAWEK